MTGPTILNTHLTPTSTQVMVVQQPPEPDSEAIIPGTDNDATASRSEILPNKPIMGKVYKLYPTVFPIPLFTDEIGKGFIIILFIRALFIRVSRTPHMIAMLKNRLQFLDMVDWASNVHHASFSL
jgi:hypothetical protein